MALFQLFKKRDFGELISDTLNFFKIYWKNYGKNYLLINGVLLILLGIIYYFLFKNFFSGIMTNNASAAEEFMLENLSVFIILFILLMLVAIIFSIFTVAYPIVYLRLLETTDKDEFTASEILDGIKKIMGRIFLFGLLSMLVMIPLVIIFMALSMALVFLLVGIPLLIVGVPAFMVWIMQSMYIYLNDEVGFIESLKQGWRSVFDGFVPKVGSTIVMLIAIQVLLSIFSIIPMFTFIMKDISGTNAAPVNFPPGIIAVYLISIILSYILYNMIYVHQGLIYYSSKESTDHISAYSEIDEIGRNV